MKVYKRANSFFAEQLLQESSPSLGRITIASTPTISYKDQFIGVQQAFQIYSSQERGELISLIVSVNDPLMTVDIRLYDERTQPVTIINDLTFHDILKYGIGMTPGQVQAGPPGQAQDWQGQFIPNLFHIQRYKDDTLVDWNGESQRVITGMLVASIPWPYYGIAIFVKNTTSTTSPTDSGVRKMHYAQLTRTIYEDAIRNEAKTLDPSTVASVEIESNPVMVDTDGDDVPDIDFEDLVQEAAGVSNLDVIGTKPQEQATIESSVVAQAAYISDGINRDEPNVKYLKKPYHRGL